MTPEEIAAHLDLLADGHKTPNAREQMDQWLALMRATYPNTSITEERLEWIALKVFDHRTFVERTALALARVSGLWYADREG